MADRLNMSLDDLIGDRKASSDGSRRETSRSHSRSGSRHRRRSTDRSYDRPRKSSSYAPYRNSSGRSSASTSSASAEPASNPANCKITVRNLSYEADETDLRNIFGRIARIRRVFIDYDRSGRSNGVAEITYYTEKDAEEACTSLNGAKLDGHEMSITKEPHKRKRTGDEDFERLIQETGWKRPEF